MAESEKLVFTNNMPLISEQEFLDHIEDDDFFLKYGNPVRVHCENGDVVATSAMFYNRVEESLQDSDIRYWIYEFRGNPGVIAKLQKTAAENHMTLDELFQARIKQTIQEGEEHPEELKKSIKEFEKSGEKPQLELVRCYPVHTCETEAQASARHKAE